MTTPFKDLPLVKKIEKVRAAMEEGDSNKKAAKRLGTTPGTIAGIRFKNKIPSKNKPGGSPEKKKRPALKIASSEATQCKKVIGNHRCAYERLPNSDHCPLHK